jgi:hypothetical protein
MQASSDALLPPSTEPAGAAPWLDRFRVVAALQVAGSLCALGFIAPGLLAALQSRIPLVMLLMFVAGSLVGLQFAAGLLLWRRDARGIPLSILAQAVQVPFLLTPHWRYSFFAGLDLIVAARSDGGTLFWPAAGGSLDFHWSPAPRPDVQVSLWGVNLVALVCFFILLEGWSASRLAAQRARPAQLGA